ncbi:uncharacterized protein C8Q71DRAFT_803146 [Rhodofomes roseus]|uniref:BTB domain-containing protein n=1 Tax=Rhodofomes roseus TaxID=34475 RepID=A0ABQ8KRS0_9APHY|nr:uncharacterized protein C8Q71DRAFT_803146 [Rhodofomes roseus]KAH9841412.1 hypothetical protein C8Q71DRAFT_803146 [Rhodofomes roseus]
MADSDSAAPVIPPTALAQPPPQGSPDVNATPEPEPPRKRKRIEDQASDRSAQTCDSQQANDRTGNMDNGETHAAPAVHDENYYDEGADCVIRVEDTLFRVHRFLLARDSSVFQDMFNLPTGEAKEETPQEGFSDEEPIHLFGETAEEFRIFLSVLYALPEELHAYRTASSDISRLLTVASLTNKYHFISTAWWAVSALYSVTSGEFGPPTHPMGDLTRASTAALIRILEVAMRCGHRRLIDFVVESWSNRILSKDLAPRAAMRVADRWDLDGLRGVAYYVQLMEMGKDFDGRLRMGHNLLSTQTQEMRPARSVAQLVQVQGSNEEAVVPAPARSTSSSEPPSEDETAPLTTVQLRRLLSGFYAMVTLWDHLRLNPPNFPRPDGCTYHMHGCVLTFRTVWLDAAKHDKTTTYGSADVVGRLRCVEDQLRASTDLACALSPGCKREALAAVKKLVKDVQEGLSARFVDLSVVGD